MTIKREGYYHRIQTMYGEMLVVVLHPANMSRETARHYAAHYVTLPEGPDDGDLHRAPIRPASATLVHCILSALRHAKKALAGL